MQFLNHLLKAVIMIIINSKSVIVNENVEGIFIK